MFGSNVVCAFTTSLGSTYTVQADSVTRIPYHDPHNPHTAPKNIFYCDQQTSEDLLNAYQSTPDYRVQLQGFGTVRITFYTDPSQSYVLQMWPAVGAFPVDMLLTPQGRPDPEGDRFHVGHDITVITSPPPEDVVAAARAGE